MSSLDCCSHCRLLCIVTGSKGAHELTLVPMLLCCVGCTHYSPLATMDWREAKSLDKDKNNTADYGVKMQIPCSTLKCPLASQFLSSVFENKIMLVHDASIWLLEAIHCIHHYLVIVSSSSSSSSSLVINK